MSLPLEFADRFGSTFIDFWRLRPRRFLPAVKENPNKYLTPMLFLVISLGIAFILLAASIGLTQTALQKVGEKNLGDPEELTIRVLGFAFVVLVVGSLFYRAIVSLWPIRGNASFRQIFDFQCYSTMIILIPLSVIGLLIEPIIMELVLGQVIPGWMIWIPHILGFVLGNLGWFFYVIPGIAVLNGVSTVRQVMGTFFWSSIVGLPIGILIGFYLG